MKKGLGSESAAKKGGRELALEILVKVDEKKAYADILLDHAFKRSNLPRRDRALTTHLVLGTLRWRERIDWHLGRALRRSVRETNSYLRNLLRLTLYQLLYLDKIPDYAAVNEAVELAKKRGGQRAAGLVNGVMRNILRERNRLADPDPRADPAHYLSVRWSHPAWLVRKWLESFGREETEALLKANNIEAPLTLRCNRLKGNRDELARLLRQQGLSPVPTPWAPQGLHLRGGPAIDQLPGFQEGLFQIQGEASQLVGHLLDPRPEERILDACAAPGGKATHIAELMNDSGELIATDQAAQGLEKLEQNVQRLALKSVRCFRVDIDKGLPATLAAPYDRILVDAPCSGLGTLRSHPEAKWQRSENDIRRLSRLQKQILNRVSGHLRAGGVLVYATCTLAREENEEVIEDFLGRRKEFALESAAAHLPEQARGLVRGDYFLALPHKHNTDGFFAARMRKNG